MVKRHCTRHASGHLIKKVIDDMIFHVYPQAQKSEDAVKDTGNLCDKIDKDFMQRLMADHIKQITLKIQSVIYSRRLLVPKN